MEQTGEATVSLEDRIAEWTKAMKGVIQELYEEDAIQLPGSMVTAVLAAKPMLLTQMVAQAFEPAKADIFAFDGQAEDLPEFVEDTVMPALMRANPNPSHGVIRLIDVMGELIVYNREDNSVEDMAHKRVFAFQFVRFCIEAMDLIKAFNRGMRNVHG